MLPVNTEVLNFVRTCEDIHALLDRGDTLTIEDRELIEFSGNALLDELPCRRRDLRTWGPSAH